jgi:hypothetical protein
MFMAMPLKTAALVLTLALAGPAAAQQTILPGYWESTSQVSVLGPGAPKTERRCITAEKVAGFLTGFSNSRYTCTYTNRSVHNGVADLQGQCVDKHGATFNAALRITYAPESFHAEARLSLPNLPITGSASTDAHRLSADCPSDGAGKETAPTSPAGPSQ